MMIFVVLFVLIVLLGVYAMIALALLWGISAGLEAWRGGARLMGVAIVALSLLVSGLIGAVATSSCIALLNMVSPLP